MSLSSNKMYESKNIESQLQEGVDNASEPVTIQHATHPQQLPQTNNGASEWSINDVDTESDSTAMHGGVDLDVQDSSYKI